jgi:TolB-like protein
LPFQNMSGDPEQEYFVDGMVEDIITGLSRIKWLFVIARNSSFTYKGKAVDIRQVGRELGVRYVLEGGVRKAGNRLRITAQLIEAETGAHLWADRFDGGIDDVFDLQDQITDKVIGIVEPSLQRSEIERARRKRPENLDAYDFYLRAVPHLVDLGPAGARIAAGLLEEALKLEPGYAAANAHMAWCRQICYLQAGFDEADKISGLRHASAAIASHVDDAAALAVAAMVIAHLGKDHETASAVIDRALALNASCAAAHYFGAHIQAFESHSAAATAHAGRALRLSPFDPLAFEAFLALGIIALHEARYDKAAELFASATRANSAAVGMLASRACALALAGRIDEARTTAQRVIELRPSFRVRIFFEMGTIQPIAERFAEGARLAGFPE